MKSFGLAVYLLNQTAQHNVHYADDCIRNIVCSKWELVSPVFVLMRFYCIMVVLVCPFFPSFRANSHGRISTVPLINVSCLILILFFYYKLCVAQYRKSVDFPTADNWSFLQITCGNTRIVAMALYAHVHYVAQATRTYQLHSCDTMHVIEWCACYFTGTSNPQCHFHVAYSSGVSFSFFLFPFYAARLLKGIIPVWRGWLCW